MRASTFSLAKTFLRSWVVIASALFAVGCGTTHRPQSQQLTSPYVRQLPASSSQPSTKQISSWEHLKGKLNVVSVDGIGNSEIPSFYIKPESAISLKLLATLRNDKLLSQDPKSEVAVKVFVSQFDWENSLGTFRASVTVNYTLTAFGVSKTFIASSNSVATLSDELWGPARNKYLMEKIADDSVSKFSNFLSEFVLPEANSQPPKPMNIASTPSTQPQPTQVPASSNQPIVNTQSRFTMEVSKKKCEDLGFKPATEAFGKCVLQLSK